MLNDVIQKLEKHMHEISQGPLFDPSLAVIQAKFYLNKLRKEFKLTEDGLKLVTNWIDLTF